MTYEDNFENNHFETYGNSVSRSTLVGALLKFDRGDYPIGRDGEILPIGTPVVPCLNYLALLANLPIDHRGGLVVHGHVPPRRADLGDTDQAPWEIGSDGQPKDPWQFSNVLPMVSVNGKVPYTFVSSSKGGLSAIGELCKLYGKNLHVAPGMYPIIELSSGSYAHKDKSIGRVKFPSFPVVGWTKSAPYDAIIAAAKGETPKAIAANPPAALLAADGKKSRRAVSSAHAVNSEIPF